MIPIAAFVSALVFGLGLIVSGMFNPSKVLGFLDVAGAWDPSLAFVMAGAVTVAAVAFRFAARRKVSLLGAPMQFPAGRRIDRRLIVGSTLFGVGWGIAGFCPGPALVALGMGENKALVFTIAMLAGMGAFALLERRRRPRFRSVPGKRGGIE
ncbi:MAG TPA: DUF6691 family protein [Casimicrobiaceae bacterium]|nr:DUF6691 family protein [Casimicrobiaceae bacterium]